MPKPKQNLNTIYISKRLQEYLRPLSCRALTVVVAPMGYGETTMINWYLSEYTRAEALHIIHISVYSENLAIFWESVQDAFARADFDFLRDYTCSTDVIDGGPLVDKPCHELVGETSCYVFVDDLRLLTDRRISTFFHTLANQAPSNVHLIVASQDRFLPAMEAIRLGARVYQIDVKQLRLSHTKLATYVHQCGVEFSEAQAKGLLYSSEGWFSAVYLNLRMFSEHDVLPNRDSDIYTTFTAATTDPLPEKQREFLVVMGPADGFTVETARSVTGDADAGKRPSALTVWNVLATYILDDVTYRFHHTMKECTECTFLMLPQERRARYRERLGLWYEQHRQYPHAIATYRKCENYDALLRVVRSGADILLASLKPGAVLEALDKCPAGTLKAYPFAVLVLIRRMFTWRQILKMLEPKTLLLTAIEECPELSEEERGNLLGECDLIMSFLCYNDISAVNRLHRSASSRMSRPAISIQKNGGWIFGSPSVLMMYYYVPGTLQSELVEMDEHMPRCYEITGGHGQGAGAIMRAEALFCQGRFADTHAELESVYAQIEGDGQANMAFCYDFLV